MRPLVRVCWTRPSGREPDETNETFRGIKLSRGPPFVEILTRSVAGPRPGRASLRATVSSEVWGPAYHKEIHYLRVYFAQLRRKLEPDPSRPRYLMTEPGMGYRFEP